jgi:hypothetical protein
MSADADSAIHVVDTASVKSWESYDMEAARASIVPAEVSFRVDGPPVRKWLHRVILRGLLENAGRTPIAITVFSGGHGAAGPFGFFVEPAISCARRKPHPPGPPLPMQAPPPPLVIELPARTAVRVWNDVQLAEYDWIPNVPREIEWSFHFWNEPRPSGKVSIP